MPRVCTVCSHEARAEIDAALVQAAPKRRIAADFGVAESSLRRHAEAHIAKTLALAADAAEVVRADDLLGDARRIQSETLAILEAAKVAGDAKIALVALDGLRRGLVLLGSLLENMGGAGGGPRKIEIAWKEPDACRACGWQEGGPLPKPFTSPEAERRPASVHPINGLERGPQGMG